ncbi:MAG: DUF262 domain-containing protein [Flavobacterium sp.]|nr:MAG: DUF262 domain-containing protein [Flavobacterium sp.]
MSELDKIRITLNGVGHFLNAFKLQVPKYQRNYAWEERHVKDLFQDISNSIYNDEKEYFIGSIVVKSNKDDREEVVDGQQRLVTITILLVAIRNYFKSIDDHKRAWKISNDYLISQDLRTEDEVPHFILNQNDHDFFVEHILNENAQPLKSTKYIKPSHKRLYDAYQLAHEKVLEVVGTSSDAKKLADWVEYIKRDVRVILVEVPDYSNAFTIFETLNDRGLDLAISDLLKNFIFHKSNNSIDKAQANWIAMTSVLESAVDESIIVPYIRYLWSSMYGNVREKELYEKIKLKLKSKAAAVEFSNQLADNSSLYLAILHSDHSFWTAYGTTTRNNIRTINQLGMVQVRPMLLSLLVTFDKKETAMAIDAIVSIIVRLLISGTLSSGIFETNFSNAAMKIRNKEITNTKQLTDFLRHIIPDDIKFKEEFSKANVSKSSLAKYYLTTIENFKRKQSSKTLDLVPNNDEAAVNVEHILPKTFSSDWKPFSIEEHRFFANRLGNQTLLSSTVNSVVGNKDFQTKRGVFKNSEFIITKELSAFQD